MREFIFYSRNAVTAGNMIKENLMKAGRMDIVIQVIISTFFISNKMRDDIKLHLIFDGPPNNPRHLILESNTEMPISKKDVAGLIKRMLYKCNEEKLTNVFPGCSIERKSLEAVIGELDKAGKNVFMLDKKGEDVRDMKLKGDEVFILGDHDGFPAHKSRFLKKIETISVSPKILFTSQVMTLLHNELDRQEFVTSK